eukprot:scaffold269487_cov21-Tisochrysis_lutea.AAC.1
MVLTVDFAIDGAGECCSATPSFIPQVYAAALFKSSSKKGHKVTSALITLMQQQLQGLAFPSSMRQQQFEKPHTHH